MLTFPVQGRKLEATETIYMASCRPHTNTRKFLYQIIILFLSLYSISTFGLNKSPVNAINQRLIVLMKAYHVPVVSYAIIDHNKIVYAHALSIEPKLHVTTESLFQAASISKSVSAYATLKLVQAGKLKLNEPVNNVLDLWEIPNNKFTKNHPVLLKQILSMTSGLSVAGFPGHPIGENLPTQIQLLNGKPPANTPPIRVFYKPGSRYFYSGGGFQVLQSVLIDVAKIPSFERLMREHLLNSLHMNNSYFLFPLPEPLAKKAVLAYENYPAKPVPGGWRNFAIGAAGGMWSTPTDLAKFILDIAASYHGNKSGHLGKTLAREMLTRQKNSSFGLGVLVNGRGMNLNFRKGGHNFGYFSEVIMFPNAGKGLAIMVDSEGGAGLINSIMPVIAHDYHWPCYFPYTDELATIPEYACIHQS